MVVTSGQPAGIFNEHGLILIKQHSIQTAVKRISGDHCYRRQVVTVTERALPDVGDIDRNRHAGQAGAAVERTRPDGGETVGKRHVGHVGAAFKRSLPHVGDTAGNDDAGQGGAVQKRSGPNAGDGQAVDGGGNICLAARPDVTGDGDVAGIGRVSEVGLAGVSSQRRGRRTAKDNRPVDCVRHVINRCIDITGKHTRISGRRAAQEIDCSQVGATIERNGAEVGDAGRNRYARQAGTGIKRHLTDARDAGGNRDIGYAGATLERSGPNGGDASGNGVTSDQAARIFDERRLVLVE